MMDVTGLCLLQLIKDRGSLVYPVSEAFGIPILSVARYCDLRNGKNSDNFQFPPLRVVSKSCALP